MAHSALKKGQAQPASALRWPRLAADMDLPQGPSPDVSSEGEFESAEENVEPSVGQDQCSESASLMESWVIGQVTGWVRWATSAAS